MNRLSQMLQQHPRAAEADKSDLADLLQRLDQCASVCAMCADACLAEPQVHKLVDCIRSDLDCADVCRATAAVLARQTESNEVLARRLLEVCAHACRTCGDICQSHSHMEHCKTCGQVCHDCAEACKKATRTVSSA